MHLRAIWMLLEPTGSNPLILSARLEAEDDASWRLRRMRPRVRIQGGGIEVGRL